MQEIYIRTRGYKIDYNVGFLLTKQLPSKMSDLKYSGDIEYPTCILERTKDKGVYLFLSGIPSQRKDSSKTTIFYDLVLKDNLLRNNERLTWLIWTWLEDVRNALKEQRQKDEEKIQYVVHLPIIEKSELGKLLDDKFHEDYIEKLLLLTKDKNWENNDNDKEALNKKLKDFISEIPKPKTMPDLSKVDKHDLETWWGGVKNDDSCKQWIKLVKKLLNGEIKPGKALLLNGGTDSSLRNLFGENEYLGVLLDREWSQSIPKKIEPKEQKQTNKAQSLLDLCIKKFHEDPQKGDESIKKKIAIIVLITTVVSFSIVGFNLYKSHLKISELSAKIEKLETTLNLSNPTKITQTIVEGEEQLSWEILYQKKALLLTIKGRNESEKQPDKICVLSVKKIENKDNENEFYLSGDKRADKDNCQKPSIVIPKEDGTWDLEHIFTDQKPRTIRVEKIYKNNSVSKSYIDFTIGKSNEQ